MYRLPRAEQDAVCADLHGCTTLGDTELSELEIIFHKHL